MLWYGLLLIVALITTLIAIFGIVVAAGSGDPCVGLSVLVIIIIACCSWWGTARIEKAYTTVQTEEAEMVVQKTDIAQEKGYLSYYVSASNGVDSFVLKVCSSDYVKIDIGDPVLVRITTKTTLGHTTRTAEYLRCSIPEQ